MPDQPKLAFVIAAAGLGRRLGMDKMSETFGESTVLETSVAVLRGVRPDAPLIAVVAPERVERWRVVFEPFGPSITVVPGGSRRQDSVRLGVEKAAELGSEIVAVHDGARPLVHPDDVVKVIDALGGGAAAILCGGVSDTVKRIDGHDVIVETIDRDCLRLAQTPQVFRVADLRQAWKTQDSSRDFSDEAAILEAGGCEVRVVVADHPNPKLTTLCDLELMRLMIGDSP
jgi:2-C-methyl-D-erythritol 4-phosphate cytidylyltransferase